MDRESKLPFLTRNLINQLRSKLAFFQFTCPIPLRDSEMIINHLTNYILQLLSESELFESERIGWFFKKKSIR